MNSAIHLLNNRVLSSWSYRLFGRSAGSAAFTKTRSCAKEKSCGNEIEVENGFMACRACWTINRVHSLGFSTTVMRHLPKKLLYRNFSRKVKRKRPKVIKQKDNVDIEGILKSSSAAPASGKPVVESAASAKDIEIKQWQASEQRTNLLKQGERRVAIVAVVTMLIAFGAIKLMFYGVERRKKPTETAEQPV